MKKITNEEQFLKRFIKYADESGEIKISKVFTKDIISQNDLHDMINSFTQKRFIQYVDIEHYRITYIGKSAYIPFWKKILNSIFKGSKITLREFASFILGIISAIVISIASKWLGLD